jgi:hypothetical protein
VGCDVSEAGIQSRVRLRAAELGLRLWRNNLGAGKLENGSYVRWGLANDSAAINAVLKSSDLIGITPHVVTLADVGRTIGVFTAVECKADGWRYNGNDAHTRAQQAFILLVRASGGRAGFITSPDQLEHL